MYSENYLHISKHPTDLHTRCIASLCGPYIYEKKSFLGRFWTIFYASPFVLFFWKKGEGELASRRLIQVIQETKAVFSSSKSRLQSCFQSLKDLKKYKNTQAFYQRYLEAYKPFQRVFLQNPRLFHGYPSKISQESTSAFPCLSLEEYQKHSLALHFLFVLVLMGETSFIDSCHELLLSSKSPQQDSLFAKLDTIAACPYVDLRSFLKFILYKHQESQLLYLDPILEKKIDVFLEKFSFQKALSTPLQESFRDKEPNQKLSFSRPRLCSLWPKLEVFQEPLQPVSSLVYEGKHLQKNLQEVKSFLWRCIVKKEKPQNDPEEFLKMSLNGRLCFVAQSIPCIAVKNTTEYFSYAKKMAFGNAYINKVLEDFMRTHIKKI